ncbi:MAG: hypothetical protein AAB927_00685 [Patescibacteria group bacterium]
MPSLTQSLELETTMTNVLNPTVTARLVAALGTALFSVIAVFAFVWTVANVAIFCHAIYEGHTGGPALVVSPVYAGFGVYLFVELVKEIHALWR